MNFVKYDSLSNFSLIVTPKTDPYVNYEQETRIIDELNGHQGLIEQIKGNLSLLIIYTVFTPDE